MMEDYRGRHDPQLEFIQNLKMPVFKYDTYYIQILIKIIQINGTQILIRLPYKYLSEMHSYVCVINAFVDVK